jgi:hypothetical protein
MTGIVYFTFAVTGLSHIRGPGNADHRDPVLPVVHRRLARRGARRGRLVEAMLGTRMPRRPVYPDRETPWYTRIVDAGRIGARGPP